MLKIFVGNLPSDASEDSVRALFSEYGKVHGLQVNADIFTGKCRGIGFVQMEGHEARAAIAGLDGKTLGGKTLRVQFDKDRKTSRQRRPR